MNVVAVARFSSIAGPIVWVLGLPIVAIYSVPFVSDGTYFWFGLVAALLGLAVAPIVLALAGPSPTPSSRVVRGLGVVTCAALVVSGALLVGGSTGLLGDKAPSWITGPPVIGVVGFFVWVPLASYSGHRSGTLGRGVFWLGILAGLSVVVPTIISLLLFYLDPGFISTNATIPFDLILDLMFWLCLPIWLVALAARMRAAGSDARKPDPTHELGRGGYSA